MKRIHFATIDENNNARILSIYDNENIAAKIKDLKLIIVHYCTKYADAVKIVETWKEAAQQ
jgi:ActR/RegA family two-component response regulator